LKNQDKADQSLSRRQFLGGLTAAAALTIVPRHVLGGPGYTAPSDKMNIACVGIGGMGATNLSALEGENIVALCDVDDDYASKIYLKYPGAKRYHDYRVMLDKQRNIDGVVVATPDHMHTVVTLAAMQSGLHVYTQKPLTRLVSEARALTDAAKKYNVVTQMGNQGHSGEDLRLICEWIWDGAIGTVQEVHAWTNRPVWPQGIAKRPETQPVPETLNWDLYLGPVKERGYNPIYHPFQWRGWWDFGTGALGDMGCHIIDSAFAALDLQDPTSVEASVAMIVNPDNIWEKLENFETFPHTSIVHFQFPEKNGRPALKLTWYDGGLFPPRPDELEPERRMPESGLLFVGDKGKLMSGDGSTRLIPETFMQSYERPEKTLPRITTSHEENWVQACKTGQNASSHFGIAGPLTETVLLGNLAVRFPQQKLEWDTKSMQVTNHNEANAYVQPDFQEGWSL